MYKHDNIYEGTEPTDSNWAAVVEEQKNFRDEVPFFITTAGSQPSGAGYYIVWAQCEGIARDKAFATLGRAWAFLYKNYSDLHPLDRNYLGSI